MSPCSSCGRRLLLALTCLLAAAASGQAQARAARNPPPRNPGPQPYRWVPLSASQRQRANQLLSIFENSSLRPDYGYAENNRDGRGVTFGRSGFCTGTGDGLLVVRQYVRQRAQRNPLARFLPILENIDRSGGGDSPLLAGAAEAQFIQAVKAAARDRLFRRAQDDVSSRLYFEPSQRMARSLGLRLAISKAQLYDAFVQHGEAAGPENPSWPTSVNGMAAWVERTVGGAPIDGVNERLWLQAFLEHRRSVLLSGHVGWAEGVQRVEIYKWLLQAGIVRLNSPLRLSYSRCRRDRKPGPCQPQPRKGELALGGVIYGDFVLP